MLDSGAGELAVKRFDHALAGRLISRQPNGQQVVFSRLISEPNFSLRDISAEDAFSMHVNCIDEGLLRIRRSKSSVERHHIPLHGAAIYDLGDLKQMSMESRFDMVRIYMPRLSLEETAREMGVRGPVRLKQPYLGFVDPLFTHISGMLVTMFANPEHAPALAVDHLGIAIQAHLLKNYGEGVLEEPKKSGGLAGWQERRSKELIESELGRVSLAQLAEECGISVGHFVRAFKKTTGVPPYQWLTARRVEKVSCLLKDTDEPLPVVAERCGFADQSHMGRAFLKHYGATPSEWRRRHRGLSI